MALFTGKCLGCNHEFYHLEVECEKGNSVYCPVCGGATELDEADLPQGEKWARKCVHAGGCVGCQKNSTESAAG